MSSPRAATSDAISNGTSPSLNFCNASRRADWLMSLEVAEHIPNEHEGAVIRNLHAHNKRGLILSWGALSQPGVAHSLLVKLGPWKLT